jgi:hypothetical protein
MSTATLIDQVRGWRLLGSCVWHAAGTYVATSVFTLLRKPSLFLHPWRVRFLTVFLQPSTVLYLLCCALSQTLATSALRLTLTYTECEPWYFIRFGHRLPIPLWIIVPLAKLGAKLGSTSKLPQFGAMVLMLTGSASTYLTLDHRLLMGTFGRRAGANKVPG